jgi:multimeric flavodoxin WrbA
MKITGITGSRRKKGNTAYLVKELLKCCEKQGAETELIYLCDHKINPCTGCEGCAGSFQCVIEDGFQEIIHKIQDSEGIVLGSPTYWYNVTADMKLFIDRCYSIILYPEDNRKQWASLFEDQGKCGVPAAICEQETEDMMGYTYNTLYKVMTDLDIKVCAGIKGFNYFGPDELKKDQEILRQAKTSAEQLLSAIKLKEKTKKLQA